jgi:hypothetical protein
MLVWALKAKETRLNARADPLGLPVTPWPDIWRRSGVVTVALIGHAAIFAVLVLLSGDRHAPLAPPREVLDVTLVTEPVQAPARAAQSSPATQAEPSRADSAAFDEPVIVETAPAAPPAERSQAEPVSPVEPAAGPVNEAVLDAPGGRPGETSLPTRSSVLRGLACARAFGREADMLGCQDGSALTFSRYTSSPGAAQVEAAIDARFNALAGLYGAPIDPALRRLPGQQGMAVLTVRREGMSGSDEMRETLPPLVPDPAFGD